MLSEVTCIGGWGYSQTQCLPQPTAGATDRLVCTLSSPLPGAGLTVEWCGSCMGPSTRPGLLCCFYGIWRISRGGSARCTGVGGEGLACFAVSGPCGKKAGRPVAGMDPQKHSVGCFHGASNFGERNWFPLRFWLGDGQGRLCFPVPLITAELSSVFRAQQLSLPLSSSPPALRTELLTLTFQMLSPAGCQNSHSPAPLLFASQPDSGALPCWAGCPSTAPAPSHQSV